ncbi:hypothetical protein [Burkholderia territorii]|uniref:hypothetical protein n=1 Tax=Burkholderia territorii TaxID=1503055 RepID=UPI0012D899BA|nr:hypothetical protein [Burkholderia territorii]
MKISRSEDPRYTEISPSGTRKYVRDQAVLSLEILSLLEAHGALACSRLGVMIGASALLVERALLDLMKDGRVTRQMRPGSTGQSHYFWSILDDASAPRMQSNGTATLAALQQKVASSS